MLYSSARLDLKEVSMDLVFGALVYFVVELLFWRPFSWFELSFVVFFALAPDSDGVPYLLLRKRLKLVSHWFIHYPLPYILILGWRLWWWSHSWFYLTTFVLASLAHFLHDSHSVPGIRWWGPWGGAYRLEGFRLVRVSELDRAIFYQRLSKGSAKRSVLDEVLIRTIRRPEWCKRRR